MIYTVYILVWLWRFVGCRRLRLKCAGSTQGDSMIILCRQLWWELWCVETQAGLRIVQAGQVASQGPRT